MLLLQLLLDGLGARDQLLDEPLQLGEVPLYGFYRAHDSVEFLEPVLTD